MKYRNQPSKRTQLRVTRVFFLSLLSRNFDDRLSSNFHRFVILCIYWDTPNVKASLWQIPIVSTAFKSVFLYVSTWLHPSTRVKENNTKWGTPTRVSEWNLNFLFGAFVMFVWELQRKITQLWCLIWQLLQKGSFPRCQWWNAIIWMYTSCELKRSENVSYRETLQLFLQIVTLT